MAINIELTQLAIRYFGFTVAVFSGDCDTGVSMHQHLQQHGLYVLRGAVLVRVQGIDDRVIRSEQGMIYLPPNAPHELEVVEDNSQFLTLFVGA